jgi:hypothetical protein
VVLLQHSLKGLLASASFFEDVRARGFASNVFQQRVGDKIRVAEEALVYAAIECA